MAGISSVNTNDCFRNTRLEDNRLKTKQQFEAHEQQSQQQQKQEQQQINEAYYSNISNRLCVTLNNDDNNNNNNNSNSNNISIAVSNCPNSINDNCHRIYTYQRQRPLSLCSLITISTLLTLLYITHNCQANVTDNSILKSLQLTFGSLQKTSPPASLHQLISAKPSKVYQQSDNSIEQNRQHKRFNLPDNQHDISLLSEWQNPCGGAFESRFHNFNRHYPKPPARHYLKQLRQTIGFEYRVLNRTLNEIDIKDMASWRLHQHRYKFLPTLKNNSKIALKRWYRNMQTFVAAFAYLSRRQYHWDNSKLLHTGRTTHELNELLISARRLLCEIETAINGSYLQNRQLKLIVITREDMRRRLKFQTSHYAQQDLAYEVSMIDMKFAKATYYNYLLSMWKILRRQMKHRMQILKAHELHNRLIYKSIDITIPVDNDDDDDDGNDDDGNDMNLNLNLNSLSNSESNLSASNCDSVSEEMML